MYDTKPFIRLREAIEAADTAALARGAQADNRWFTAESVQLSLTAIAGNLLRPEKLEAWLAAYPIPAGFAPKRVGIVMAGNIPLAGLFDLLCAGLCGHRAYIKVSSKDRVLMSFAAGVLRQAGVAIEPLADDTPLDAVIATGSDNTNRYFRSRYAGIPHLLRGSRTSLAVLGGGESEADLRGLARDVFDHFGMGCRSVSKIFVPRGGDLRTLVDALKRGEITHPGYRSAYRHHKALLRLRGVDFADGGFFTLRASDGFSEALPDLIHTAYRDLDEVKSWISLNDGALQCIVTEAFDHPRRAGFGRAQRPEPWDYPDGKDVMEFLLNI
jgi:hypothetical protein